MKTGIATVIASCLLFAAMAGAQDKSEITLRNEAGLAWQLPKTDAGWVLGALTLHGKQIEQPVMQGLLFLRNLKTGEVRWVPGSEAQAVDARTARFTGQTTLKGVVLKFSMEVALDGERAVARMTPRWSVDKDLDFWEIGFACHGASDEHWRCTMYPFAGNSSSVDVQPMWYVGVPAALLFREDLSVVALFGVDPSSDYFNPNTWTRTTGFHFKSGVAAPQFCVGAVSGKTTHCLRRLGADPSFGCGPGKLWAGVDYVLPLQLFLSDAGNSIDAIHQVVRDWIKINDYKVEPLQVRTPQEAFDLYVNARRTSPWWHPGKGYQIHEEWPVIYIGESPANAWFDYLVYEQTGDPMWRDRAYAMMDLVLRAQHTDPSDPHYGVLETNYELRGDSSSWLHGKYGRVSPYMGEQVDPELKSRRFNSNDHSYNFGYKLDMNGYAAVYMLKLWERVKQKEGIDKQNWREAAVRIADWVVRQQNPDGGLPQAVDYRQDAPHPISVISGRTLVGMPTIARITGDKKYSKLADDLEQFLRTRVENRYWFTGAHVDLPPPDYESDSVWHAVEYWLDKYDRTKEPECLKRAEADAMFAFLMWCPKQLSWIKNPTQTCHTEQEHYLQYSNYCYNNSKIKCLDRLAKQTGNPLFGQLRDRTMQCGFWCQVTSGKRIGGQSERMSDPWLGVSGDFNSKGISYFCELALEANLQLLEMGLVK